MRHGGHTPNFVVVMQNSLEKWQCLFYGLDDDLWTRLLDYYFMIMIMIMIMMWEACECDLSEDEMIFYRPIVDRLGKYYFVLFCFHYP